MIEIDQTTGDYIVNGFENGISNDPYTGIADMRNINIISVPKEASVNFATSLNSTANTTTGTVSSANAGTFYMTYTGATNLTNGQAITFSVQSGLNVTTSTVYWVLNVAGAGAGTFQITSDFQQATTVHVTNGTGTFISVPMNQPKYFTKDNAGGYWLVDAIGQVWFLNNVALNNWRYTGNSVPTSTYTSGNGIVYYEGNNGDGSAVGYIFVFHNGSIDYTPSAAANIAWVYQWVPSTAATGVYSATPTKALKTAIATANSHEALLAPDNKVYYCDANWVGRFYQTATATKFVPTNTATYTFDQTKILPFNDIGNTLTWLGSSILVGGSKNIVYPWDTFSQLPSYPIFIAEYNIVKILTVNTNAYLLAGNRGRIYITNGNQAQLYKKIPDHISGTVEPYFTWGGLTSNKNQLYFSASVTTNAGVANNNYGGLWGIDLDTKALRLTNKLSYATYAGYATAIIPNFSASPAGIGLFIGWDSGVTTYGIDTTLSTPYTAGEATIDSDLVPIGTVLKPTTNGRIEFKLSVPMVSGESVQIQYRQKFSDSFATITGGTFSTVGDYSGVIQNVNFQNSQWIQLRAILTSTATAPSFTRLTECRLGM